jgi:hypothetical protein
MSRVVLALALSAGCASATGGGPRVLSIADIRAEPVFVGEWIADYERAVSSVVAIMGRDLRLPRVTGVIQFYANRDAFRAALEADGYTPAFAQDAAARLAGIGGVRRVLLNDATMRRLDWPQRISLLAHELTHTVQYDLSGGRRGTSDQWLREGFAEWIEVGVIDRLGFIKRAAAREIAVARVRAAVRRGPLPVLSDLMTIADWVATLQHLSEEALYAEAFLAVDLLIERHSVPAVIDYFRLFSEEGNRLGNFRSAFGQDFSQFDAEFQADLVRRIR